MIKEKKIGNNDNDDDEQEGNGNNKLLKNGIFKTLTNSQIQKIAPILIVIVK